MLMKATEGKTMKVEFNDTQYRFSHGRTPRGRGSWAFEINGIDGIQFSPSMTYAEAKRWMIGQARELVPAGVAVVTVEVLP